MPQQQSSRKRSLVDGTEWSKWLSPSTWMASGVAVAWLGQRVLFKQRRQHHHHHSSSRNSSSSSFWPIVLIGASSSILIWNGILRIPIGSSSRRHQQQRRLYGQAVGSNGGRRLGLLERWYVAHTRAGVHTGIVLCLECESEKIPKLAEIRKYLQRVSAKFSWLRCKVRRDGVDGVDTIPNDRSSESLVDKTQMVMWGDDLYIEPCDELCQPHARQVILRMDSDFFDGVTQVMNEESTKQWNDENPAKPLWRATLVVAQNKDDCKKFAIILSFHHLLTDGIGAMEVAQALLDASNGKLVTLSPSDVGTYLPAPMEDIMDTSPQLGHLLIPLLNDRFPKLCKRLWRRHWTGNPIHLHDQERKTQLVRVKLVDDAVTMENLHQYSRKNNISMNSLVSAILIKVLARVIEDHSRGTLFKIQVPADERRRRVRDQVAPEDLGVYLTAPQFYINVSAVQSVPRIGKSFQMKLKASLATSHMDIGLCQFIRGDWINYAKRSCFDSDASFHSSLEVSHLNSMDDLKGGIWNISSVWMAQGYRGLGSTIKASLISARTNMMTATLSSIPEVVTVDMLMKIAHEWKSELNNII